MSSSLSSAANIYDGPVHALYKSVPFYAKASVKLSPSVNTMDIMSDAWGKLGARKGNVAITVDLEPAGEFESAAIALLHPFTTLQRGLPIGVTRSLVASGSINTTSNRLTITGHPYSAADAVTVGTSAVLPSPLATGTL